MFPTGNLVDDLEVPDIGTLKATMITAGIPTVFVNADDIGYTGTELREHINTDPKALEMFEKIRVAGALRMGLIKTPEEAQKRQHTPKIAFVAPPKDYVASSGKRIAAERHRPAGARAVHGQAAPRDDGHGGRGDRHGGSHPGHAGEPGGGRRPAHGRTLRPPVGHAPGGRRGARGRRPVDRHQGHHEPQRHGC